MSTLRDRSIMTQITKQQDTETVMPEDLNMAKRLVAALKAVTGPTVVTQGLLRDLFTQDNSLGMAIGGHRGMGENLITDQDMFQAANLWRENTITSFLKAQQHGASFVEMDVQVTRDGVPVIWHDDEIAFGARSNPFRCQICDLHFDEFRSIGPQLSSDETGRFRELITLHRKFRNLIQNTNSMMDVYNPWHCFDDDALPSLEQVLNDLPESLSINLEIKMTTPSTLVQTPPHEVLRATQSVINLLSKSIQQRGSSRRVLLSSFDPDVCVEMRRQLKASGIDQVPIMYITTGGSWLHSDPRRMSISAAIQFCIDNEIGGFVVDTSILRQEKHLMELTKLKRLQVVTYGLENNDVEWLMEQWNLGVQGAIVDDVAKVVPLYVKEVQDSLVQTRI
eukprot:g7144.t1